MRLRDVGSLVDLGRWLQDKGITPSEHPDFGGVHDGHTEGSLHYGGARNIAQMRRRSLEGRALDVNDLDPIDDRFRKQFRNEREALTFLYFKLLRAADKFDWPLDETFFNGFGYIKEEGSPDEEPNRPIGGHDGTCTSE
ncbi:MAG TPA: hypothetical protein VF129_00315 [Actinomycetota bacterium]